MNKEKVLWGIAVVALVLAGWATIRLWPNAQSTNGFGAPGNMLAEQYIPYVLYNGGYNSAKDFSISGSSVLATTTVDQFTQGGNHCSLTDANGGAYTLTQAQMETCSVFKFVAGGAGQEVIQLTTPATSTLTTLLASAGDTRTWIYDASALAAATTTTWTAGTGINQIAATTNDDLIDGLEYSVLTCWREADTDVSCIVSELVASD